MKRKTINTKKPLGIQVNAIEPTKITARKNFTGFYTDDDPFVVLPSIVGARRKRTKGHQDSSQRTGGSF